MEKQTMRLFGPGGPIRFGAEPTEASTFVSPQSSATTQPDITILHPPKFPQRIDLGNYFQQTMYSLEKRVERLEDFFGISSVVINTLASNKWELKHPLSVAIEQRDAEDFVACLYDIGIYGYGDTVPEALEDLRAAIMNQFEYIIDQAGSIQLGSLLQRQLEFLKGVLVEKNV